jgi:hypothetical protein
MEREEDPVAYLRVLAGLMPKQTMEKVDPFDEWTADELEQLADWLQAHREATEAARPPDTLYLPRASSL